MKERTKDKKSQRENKKREHTFASNYIETVIINNST